MNTYHYVAILCVCIVGYAVFTGRGSEVSHDYTIVILLVLGEIRYYIDKKFPRQIDEVESE